MFDLQRFESLLVGAGRSKNTIKAYKSDLVLLRKHLNNISVEDIQRTLNSMRVAGYSNASIIRALSSLKVYCSLLSIDINFKRLMRPKNIQKESDYVTDLSFEEGLDSINKKFVSKIYNKYYVIDLFTVLYYTGLRLNELKTLKNEFFNKETGFLTIIGKGDKERKIPIHYKISDILEDIHFYKFLEKVSSSTISYWSKKYFGETITPHSFRHGFVTKLIKNGAKPATVQKVCGHESFTTTLRYFHMNNDEIKEDCLSALTERKNNVK